MHLLTINVPDVMLKGRSTPQLLTLLYMPRHNDLVNELPHGLLVKPMVGRHGQMPTLRPSCHRPGVFKDNSSGFALEDQVKRE